MPGDLPPLPGAERRHVVAGDVRLHVAEAGSGRATLLIHGWPQHHWCWRRVLPRLAEDRRAIAWDLRGFGWSEAPGRGYDAATFAADAVALLDALEIERADVIGHDWGGFAALLLAIQRPDRVSGVLALSCPLPWVPRSPAALLSAWRGWYAAAIAAPVTGRRAVRPVASGLLHSELEPGAPDAYLRRLARREQVDATVALYRSYLATAASALAGPGRGPLQVPARLLLGSRDPAISPALVRGQEHHGEALAIELVEGARHLLPETHPDLVVGRARSLFA